MRNTRELLEILRDKIIDCPPTFFTGMCGEIFDTYVEDLIDRDESKVLDEYLESNLPEGFTTNCYWWTRGLKQPRIDWLENEICKLLGYEKY